MQRLNSFPGAPSLGDMMSADFWRQINQVANLKMPTKADLKRFLKKHSPKANYFYFHLSYFVLFMLTGGAIIWAIERSNSKIDYIDALFTSVSAMSETGLTSKDFSQFKVGSQVIVSISKQ